MLFSEFNTRTFRSSDSSLFCVFQVLASRPWQKEEMDERRHSDLDAKEPIEMGYRKFL